MRLERRHAVILLAIAAWNVLSYANFARNLFGAFTGGEDRSTGYYVAHVVLIAVNLVIAVYLTGLGWRAWRAGGSAGPGSDRTMTGQVSG